MNRDAEDLPPPAAIAGGVRAPLGSPPGPPANTASITPGDLLTLPQLAEHPLEWAVLDRDGGRPPRLLLVPADTHPATGSADVRIAARSATGPLSLRCAFSAWLPERFLANAHIGGRLDPDDRARAQRRAADLEKGGGAAAAISPLDRETDSDPEYTEWIAQTVAPAAAALDAARAGWEAARDVARLADRAVPAPPVSAQVQWLRFAVAALFVASVGLAWRSFNLQQLLKQPVFDMRTGGFVLDGPSRGPENQAVRFTVASGSSVLLLTIGFGRELPAHATGHVEIHQPDGQRVWSSPSFQLPDTSQDLPVQVLLPRAGFPASHYRLAFYLQHGTKSELFAERDLDLDTPP